MTQHVVLELQRKAYSHEKCGSPFQKLVLSWMNGEQRSVNYSAFWQNAWTSRCRPECIGRQRISLFFDILRTSDKSPENKSRMCRQAYVRFCQRKISAGLSGQSSFRKASFMWGMMAMKPVPFSEVGW